MPIAMKSGKAMGQAPALPLLKIFRLARLHFNSDTPRPQAISFFLRWMMEVTATKFGSVTAQRQEPISQKTFVQVLTHQPSVLYTLSGTMCCSLRGHPERSFLYFGRPMELRKVRWR